MFESAFILFNTTLINIQNKIPVKLASSASLPQKLHCLKTQVRLCRVLGTRSHVRRLHTISFPHQERACLITQGFFISGFFFLHYSEF